MRLLIQLASGCLLAGVSFVVGACWGHDRGEFRAGLEENKIAAACLKAQDLSLSPDLREFLKGRIYYNLASKYPNKRGYLLRRDWDFGAVDSAIMKRRIYVKDPAYAAESFEAATRHLSQADLSDL